MEEESAYTSTGHELLSLAREINFIAQRCSQCNEEEFFAVKGEMIEKIRDFSSKCQYIGNQLANKNPKKWQKILDKSRQMAEAAVDE